jgi:hypothetical protein
VKEVDGLTWGSDDWSWWVGNERKDCLTVPAPFDFVHQILSHLPGRLGKTIAHLGSADAAMLQFLASSFAHVIAIHDTSPGLSRTRLACAELGIEFRRRALGDLGSSGDRFDVLLAVDALARAEVVGLDAILARTRSSLVEGGLLLATFPAAPHAPVAYEMRLRDTEGRCPSPRLHEIELQYRLRRAGYRGVRIRRLRESGEPGAASQESLLCMAVRRANN